jgi:hypothetical protein
MFILAAFRGGRNALLQKIGRLGVTPPILQALTLSSSSIPENSPSDTIVGSIFNLQPSSIATLSDDAGGRFKVVTIAGSRKIAAAAVPTNYEAATSHNITIVETLAGATGNPKPTTLSIAVGNLNDTNPNAFTLNDVTGVVAGSVQTSNAITIAGLGAADTVTAAVSGDASSQLQRNGGAWVSGPIAGVVNTDTIAVRHTAAASGSTIVNTTLTIGTTSDTFSSTTAAATMSAPVLTKTSGAGVNPMTFSEAIPADVYAGYGREIQAASDNGFVTILQDLYDAVTEGQIAGDADDWTTARRISDDVLEALLLSWTGTRYFRMRYFLDLDASTRITSAWSNTITETFSSVALSATNKHANMTVSGAPLLTAQAASFDGAAQLVAADTVKTGGVRMWAFKLTAIDGELGLGIDDGTGNFVAASGVNSPRSGQDNAKGVYLAVWSTGFQIVMNTAGTMVASGSAGAADGWAVNDEYTFVQDDTANTVKIWRTRAGIDRLLGTATGVTQAAMLPFGGGNRNGVTGTFNFGGSPFALAVGNQDSAVGYQS